MNTSRCGMRALAAIALAHLLTWPTPTLAEGLLVITVHGRRETAPSATGRSTIQTWAVAVYQGALGADKDNDASLGTGIKLGNQTLYPHAHLGTTKNVTLTESGQIIDCPVLSCGGTMSIDVCKAPGKATQYDHKTSVTIIRDWPTSNFEDQIETVRIASEHCRPPTPLPCDCFKDSDCYPLYPGEDEELSWNCVNCVCVPNLSPLVIHLPDYFSSGGGTQNWWKRGFCGPEAPTVCLDWLGDGNVTCTGWTSPESEIAFVVALSDDDMLVLSKGYIITAEPWRHFFGNVTKGPEGNLPFAHGFEALAAHCGVDPEATSEIDFTECGLSLHVWADSNSDGNIAPDELLEFQDLGVESLGDVRETGKTDRCGNTFPFESHATCSGHPGKGKCGTWLDVFFEPR